MKRAELDVWDNISMTKRAAAWVRKKYNIPDHSIIQEEFEREFNCTLVMRASSERDSWTAPEQINFNTAADMTLFLLRWS